jgi:hypothetical protein
MSTATKSAPGSSSSKADAAASFAKGLEGIVAGRVGDLLG